MVKGVDMGLHCMKAVYSYGCGQIATVRAIEFTFGEQATGSSWREGQCCIIVAGVIIVIVVIVAGVHRRCHRHRPWREGQFQAKG